MLRLLANQYELKGVKHFSTWCKIKILLIFSKNIYFLINIYQIFLQTLKKTLFKACRRSISPNAFSSLLRCSLFTLELQLYDFKRFKL